MKCLCLFWGRCFPSISPPKLSLFATFPHNFLPGNKKVFFQWNGQKGTKRATKNGDKKWTLPTPDVRETKTERLGQKLLVPSSKKWRQKRVWVLIFQFVILYNSFCSFWAYKQGLIKDSWWIQELLKKNASWI